MYTVVELCVLDIVDRTFAGRITAEFEPFLRWPSDAICIKVRIKGSNEESRTKVAGETIISLGFAEMRTKVDWCFVCLCIMTCSQKYRR